MKRKVAALMFCIAALATLCAGLCACNKKESAAANNVAVNAEKTHTEGGLIYTLKSGGDDGAYYAVEAESKDITSAVILNELNDLPVTCIAEEGFASCYALTYLTLPDTLTKICDNAFNGCSALISITLPASLQTIGEDAFSGCYKLWQVYNFSSLNIVRYNSSYGSVAVNARAVLTSEEEGIYTTVGDFTFYAGEEENFLLAYTGSSTSVSLPQNFEGDEYSVAGYCFYMRGDITSVSVPSQVTSLGSYAFYGCSALAEVTLSDGLKQIGSRCFADCTALTQISLPDTVESVYSGALSGCTSLVSARLSSSLSSISTELFRRCTSLKAIEIPSSVRYIYKYAFATCTSLYKVVLPDYLIAVQDGVFSGCKSLVSVTLDKNLTDIGEQAFSSCDKLVEIKNNSGLSLTAGSDSLGRVAYFAKNIYTEESGESKLEFTDGGFIFFSGDDGRYFMGYFGDETEITLPQSEGAHIYSCAFYDAKKLKKITVPSGYVSVDDKAFFGCSLLEYVFLPATVAEASSSLFGYCKALTTVEFGGTIEEWRALKITKPSTSGSYKIVCSDGETY